MSIDQFGLEQQRNPMLQSSKDFEGTDCPLEPIALPGNKGQRDQARSRDYLAAGFAGNTPPPLRWS